MKIQKAIRNMIAPVLVLGAAIAGRADTNQVCSLESLLPKTTIESRVALEDNPNLEQNPRPHYQHLVKMGSNRAMLDTKESADVYGLNLQNENFRLNVGHINEKPTGETQRFLDSLPKYNGTNWVSQTPAPAKVLNDTTRVLAEGMLPGIGFVGGEVVEYQDTNKQDRVIGRAGVVLPRGFEIEAVADNIGNKRVVGFYVNNASKLVLSLGGGENANETRELNFGFSTQVTPDYGIGAHVRVGDSVIRGDGEFQEGRVRFGRNVSWQKARNMGVRDACYNDIGPVGDVTDPSCLEKFGLFGADACVGDRTFDVGGDFYYKKDVSAYGNLAINLGDYSFVKDVTFSPEIHKDIAKDISGSRIGLSAKLDLGIGTAKIWGQRTFNEDQKPVSAVYISIGTTFGGK